MAEGQHQLVMKPEITLLKSRSTLVDVTEDGLIRVVQPR